MRFNDVIGKVILGGSPGRFASAVYALRMLATRFSSLPPRQDKLADALYFSDKLVSAMSAMQLHDAPFHFNLLRLGVSELLFLFERIAEKDSYMLSCMRKQDPVIVDVGAHLGVMSRHAKHVFPGARVLSVEPDPENFALLTRNMEGLENCSCHHLGVLDGPDELVLEVSKLVDWRSSFVLDEQFRKVDETYTEACRVQVVGLDDFLADQGVGHVDLLKITVPGELEMRVLRGAQRTIETCRPQVAVYVYDSMMEEARAFFTGLGGYVEHPCPYEPSKNIKIFVPEG